jgi:hypothetical protein
MWGATHAPNPTYAKASGLHTKLATTSIDRILTLAVYYSRRLP